LVILSDLHWGNPFTVKKLVRKNINKCRMKNINEVWLGGDLLEYVNKKAVGKQIIPIEQQIDEIIKLLEPIKDKITKIIYGNHEERAMRNRDIEPTRVVALELGLKKVYMGSNRDTGVKWDFKYYIEHPLKGSGKTKGYYDRLNRTLRNNHNAELFIIPHFHTLFTDKHYQLDINKKLRVSHWFVYGGGYVDYWGSYGHDIHANVERLGSRKLVFDLKKHNIEVEML